MRLWLMKIVDIDVEVVVENSAGNSLVTADSLEQLNFRSQSGKVLELFDHGLELDCLKLIMNSCY